MQIPWRGCMVLYAITQNSGSILSVLMRPLTTIFFLDSDAVPVRGSINVLLGYGEPVSLVPNLIFDRAHNKIRRMVYDDHERVGEWSLDYPPNSETTTAFEKVGGSGMSGLLVAREVFEKLEDPWFRFIYDTDGRLLLGEDVYFYRNVRHAGYDVWCEYALPQQHFKTVNLMKVWKGANE